MPNQFSKGGTKAPTHQENDPMSDQSTRARDPNPDPRQPFTLGQEDAQALYGLASDPAKDANDLNAWWLEAGQRLGFVWTTVQGLTFVNLGSQETPGELQGVSFTAWPTETEWQPDPDAEAWLADMVTVGDPTTLKNRELILRAFSAGSDHGFAMGVATQPQVGLGWDGMELIRESAELLRGYEAHHRAKVGRGQELADLWSDNALADFDRDAIAKAERNAAQAERLEAFLADPTQSHLVHDGLREAREDNATAALAGWHAAMLQVRELVESGRAQAGSAIPPLVLLSRLEELPPPEDMDEVFQRLRNPMAEVERLRVALREWFDKSEWVREAVDAGIPKKLGMRHQWGLHRMDTAREMVARLNTLLAEAIADRLVGLRVQAAADVLQAMGIADPGAAGQAVRPGSPVRTRSAEAVPGVYSPDQGEADCGGSAAMLGAIHGDAQ